MTDLPGQPATWTLETASPSTLDPIFEVPLLADEVIRRPRAAHLEAMALPFERCGDLRHGLLPFSAFLRFDQKGPSRHEWPSARRRRKHLLPHTRRQSS